MLQEALLEHEKGQAARMSLGAETTTKNNYLPNGGPLHASVGVEPGRHDENLKQQAHS